jgi:PTS system ascorbate-specific IIB component
MIKVLCACASGSGSSLLCEMATKKALKALGLKDGDFSVTHCPLGEAKGQARLYNVLLVGLNFVSNFADVAAKGVTVIGVKNLMSDKEIGQKLQESGIISL